MLTDSYKVRLDSFEGPLDLLLFLIKKSEVEVHEIPVAMITEQYLEFLAQLRAEGTARIDIDVAGEFLVMAATLMEIKSRMLMPRPPVIERESAGGPAEDPRAELVRQLVEYKKYRDAADALDRRGEDWRRRFPASRAGVPDAALREAIEQSQDVELEDLDLLDLAEAFRRIAETVNFDRLGEHEVTYDDTPIEVHTEDILTRLAEGPRENETELATLLRGRRRHEMIGLFLALLELVRKHRVAVRQDKTDGSIYLGLRADEAGGESVASEAPA